MLRLRTFVASVGLFLVSCTGSITFRSPVDYTIDLSAYSSRYAAVSGLVASNMIASLPCSPGAAGDAACMAPVPASGNGSDVVLHCSTAGYCDPDPYPFVQDLGVQDFSSLASSHVSVLDRLELARMDLTVDANTANVAVPSFEVRWGSESSSAMQLDTTTQRLATVPMIAVGQTGVIDVTLDDAGLAALTAYLHGTSKKARFFLRSNLDVNPGQPIPSGSMMVTVGFIVRASGQLH